MPKGTIIDLSGPFNIRNCPIWVIPQIAKIRRMTTGDIVEFWNRNDGTGFVIVSIPEQGTYEFEVRRDNMNAQRNIYDVGFKRI